MMGDMADYYIQQDIDRMLEQDVGFLTGNEDNSLTREDYIHCLKVKKWPTRKGFKFIKDMDDQHINNALSKCKREQWRVEFISLFEEEITKRQKNEFPWMNN